MAFSSDGELLASASVDEAVGLWDIRVESLMTDACRIANRVGDTNYSSPTLAEYLARYGVNLLAPEKSSLKRERHPWGRWLTGVRRRIETVISQLVERYGMKRVGARDVWHLSSHFWRKILGHTCCVVLCQRAGLSPLRFSELVTD